MENQTGQGYCEKESILHDDVINSEIEQEHKEQKSAKKNINVKVEFAPEDEREEFSKKLRDKNYFAIETKLTMKFVDFVDISEFNSQPVIGAKYEEKLFEFLEANKHFTPELSDKMTRILKDSGLAMTYFKVEGQEYNPLISHLEDFKNSIIHGDLSCLEKLLGLTPPPKKISPKLAINFLIASL